MLEEGGEEAEGWGTRGYRGVGGCGGGCAKRGELEGWVDDCLSRGGGGAVDEGLGRRDQRRRRVDGECDGDGVAEWGVEECPAGR